jgi:hypothetical protein
MLGTALSCSFDFCTLYVSTSTKNPKFSKKAIFQKSQNMQKKTKFFQKIQKNGLLCSLRGLCYLHGLLGLSHSVKK